MTRDVNGIGSDGAVAAEEALCTNEKLDTDVVSSATAACVTYAWDTPAPFDDCPTDCDLQESTPFPVAHFTLRTNSADEAASRAEAMPDTTRICVASSSS